MSDSIRTEILRAAESMVSGQRQQDYGTPENNFARIAALWSAYTGNPYTPADVAAMMILLKVARIKTTPSHRDSWTDIAGYAACGGEVAS